MNTKTPGFETRAVLVDMSLNYDSKFEKLHIPEAYEALILDAIKGDHSNFVRNDELDAAWKVGELFGMNRMYEHLADEILRQIFTPILHWIEGPDAPRPKPYPYGSRGPAELDKFVEAQGFRRSEEAL